MSLLKETRKKCRQLNYQFTGYTINEQVRERKSEEEEFIILESMHNLSYIICSICLNLKGKTYSILNLCLLCLAVNDLYCNCQCLYI